jgi:hypothetical protein
LSATRRFALRRLDPFLGVTQVVENEAGRSLSVDGVNWEIQLRATLPAGGWGVLNRGRGENAFFRFGVWSRAEGLARFPPARNVDPNAAERDAAALLAQVEEALPALPLPLVDTLECWLLDADRKPLALLASLPPDAPLPERGVRRWRPALPDPDAPGTHDFARLATWVAQRALPTPCWIAREADDSGRGVAAGERFAAGAFPETLVALPNATDAATADADLGARYLEWLAPRLLMLPLAAATRAALEIAAASRPEEVAHFFRLYPEIRDPARLNAVRVQARLIATA